jgi:hypothetical protein
MAKDDHDIVKAGPLNSIDSVLQERPAFQL